MVKQQPYANEVSENVSVQKSKALQAPHLHSLKFGAKMIQASAKPSTAGHGICNQTPWHVLVSIGET